MIACVYACWDDRDRAFEWLDKAVARRSTELVSFPHSSMAKHLRDDPRFAAFLAKLNLPPG
jgi:hypothetical protein